MRRTNAVKMVTLYPIFVLLAAVILYPLAWMFYSSLKGNEDIFSNVFAVLRRVYLDD